jgi:glycosyltransferase involved in cell wall biosynthesis
MNERRVSIVINNYNYSEFLEACIESAMSQTYKNLEIIVVDDGSTDQSRSVLEKYRDQVLVILKEHGGETSGRNAGFQQANGEIVAFLDSDDFLQPDTVERIVESWQPAYAKLQFPLRVVNRHGESTGLLMPRCRLDEGRVDHLLLSTGRYITSPGSGNFYARWLLERIMPVPVSEWPQSVDSYAATFAGFYGEIGVIHEPLGFYRVHDCNMTRSVADDGIDVLQIERLMGRGLRLRTLIEKIARDLQVRPNPGIVTRHWLYLKLELAQLRLGKKEPVSKMLAKAWQMVISALTSPELTPVRRAQLIGWTLGTVALPMRVAVPVIRTAFELAPSGWMPRALRRL